MNALTRFERMDELVPEMFRRFMQPMGFSSEQMRDIRLDLTENDKDYVVRAEIPGAKKEDIRIDVDGNRVSISAETHKEREQKSDTDGRVLLRETYSGSVSRSFSLAHDVDEATSTAKLEDGVLTLTLPKRTGSSNRRIAVQ